MEKVQERDANYYYLKEWRKRKELEEELKTTNEYLMLMTVTMYILLAVLLYLDITGRIIA